jgi:hypothetical protein
MASGQRCNGSAEVQWFPFGANNGGASDQASCAASCTSYAPSHGLSQWCCELYQDSDGSTWVCRVYDAYSKYAASGARFASLGRCQSP